MLRTDSYDHEGQREEPTVTKLDNGRALATEVRQTKRIAELVGAEAIRLMRGPLFVDQRGEEKQESVDILRAAECDIDGPLVERLLDSSILLLRCSWLASAAADEVLTDEHGAVVIHKRQELQRLAPEAFFSPAEATELLERGDRSVLTISQ